MLWHERHVGNAATPGGSPYTFSRGLSADQRFQVPGIEHRTRTDAHIVGLQVPLCQGRDQTRRDSVMCNGLSRRVDRARPDVFREGPGPG